MIPTGWSTPITRGHTIEWAATVEGIPYIFSEKLLKDTAGSALSEPTGYRSTVPALAITDGQSVSCEIDRQTGVATGRAWEMLLSGEELEGQDILSQIFKRPTLRATLTSSDVTGAATTLTVDSVAGGWGTSGTLYAGLETINYGGTTATQFTSCTRGVVGRVFPLVAGGSPSQGYRTVTDRPTQWKGRLVSLWAHLVSPEGRALSSDWCTAGAYCVEVWSGYVEALPTWTSSGISIRCLPLVRKLADPVGAEITGTVDASGIRTGDQGDMAIRWSPTDAVNVVVDVVGTGVVLDQWLPLDPTYGDDTVSGWAALLQSELGTALGGGYLVRCEVAVGTVRIMVIRLAGGDVRLSVNVHGTWFLRPGPYLYARGDASPYVEIPIEPGLTLSGTGWLPVVIDADEAWQSVSVSSTGAAEITANGVTELVTWDDITTYFGSIYLLRINGRAPWGQRANIWTDGATVSIATGSRATMVQALGELFESSGLTTTTRGTYDTLGRGYGLGLLEARLDVDSLGGYPWGGREVDASGGEESIEERLGGWFALVGQCLVQRTNDSGVVQITPVSSVVTSSDPVLTISASDALLSGHEPAELIESPTEVKIEYDKDLATIARDIPRVEAEGVVRWDIRARGAEAPSALVWGIELIALTDGASVVSLEIGSHVPVRIGDVVTLTTAHPLVYDWASGSAGIASTTALVVGHTLNIASITQAVTLLLPGQVEPGVYLAPSGVVVSVDTATTVTVTTGVGQYFLAADKAYTYTPGNETATGAELTVDTVAGDAITFTGAHGLSVGDVVTYPTLANATAAQAGWAYRDSGTVFR